MIARILALGGHDFTSRPPDRAVCELMLRLATERAGGRPQICILPTASGDTSEQIGRFYATFGERACEPSDLSLFRLGRRPMALRDHLLAQDLVYVGGGSLVNLLAVWEAHEHRRHPQPRLAPGDRPRRAERRGDVLVRGRHHQVLGQARAGAGLGLLDGSLCVHYNNEPERRAAYLDAVGDGMPGGYGLDDYAGLLWEGTAALGGDRPPRRPRLPRHGHRERRHRGPDAGPLPARPGPRDPARGHSRVPPHHSHAKDGRAGWARKLA